MRVPEEAMSTPLTMAPMLIRECVEAEPSLMRALIPVEEAPGTGGSHAAEILSNLALLYEAQGKDAKAQHPAGARR